MSKIRCKASSDQIRKMSLSLVKLEMRVARIIGNLGKKHCVQTVNGDIFQISESMLQKGSVSLESLVLLGVYIRDDGIRKALAVHPIINDTYIPLSTPEPDEVDSNIPKLKDKAYYPLYSEFTTTIPKLSKDDSRLVAHCEECSKRLQNLKSDDTNKNKEKQTRPPSQLNKFDELLKRHSKTLQENPRMIVDSKNSEGCVSIQTGRILYKLFLATELFKLRGPLELPPSDV